jgi:cytochrome c oxidase assembly protein subunit 11
MAGQAAAPAGNRRVAMMAAAFALAMLGLGYAAVPFYRLFCQVTGFNGTPMRASAEQARAARAVAGTTMSIRFDANVEPSMKWAFRPEKDTITVPLGQRNLAFFEAENLTDQPMTGQASYNIEPEQAAPYFLKIQCFCFTRQTLQPHQKVRMPVTFFVDPKILNDPDASDVQQITLSYTFHPLPAGVK